MRVIGDASLWCGVVVFGLVVLVVLVLVLALALVRWGGGEGVRGGWGLVAWFDWEGVVGGCFRVVLVLLV